MSDSSSPDSPASAAPSSALTRRGVLRAGGALVAAARSTAAASVAPAAAESVPFAHGVASGDPLPDGVLVWTRVTPVPQAQPGTGAGPEVTVHWDVARDEAFSDVVARGSVRTGAHRDHTVKVDVTGLEPATAYWYRFRYGSDTSPVGRTRTAPAVGAAVERLRFGVVSCSDWQAGHFAAYRHLAERDDLDLVVHLGDYLYEYGVPSDGSPVRPHDPEVEMTTLAHYRRRHAQYKTDPHLAALHARVPFVVTWDDHESANDAWAGGAENHTEPDEGTWEERRAASQQAYAEWMPVRYEPGGHLYRRLTFGTLAELSMLDLRSHRSRQVAHPFDRGIHDPDRTIAGRDQLGWLTDGLVTAGAQWKLVGNSVMIAPVQFPSTLTTREFHALTELVGPIEGVPYNVDQWDGYTHDRATVFRTLRDHGVRDTVFLTGDIHSAWACELPANPLTYPLTRDSVGVELVCTSVTSDNLDEILRVPPRTASLAVETAIRVANPHVKHLDFDSHGFSVLDVTPSAVQMDWYALRDRTDPATEARHSVSYVVRAGTQRVTRTREALR
ncbi:phosphodiesterase/alkaline phosphatase D [Saccharomonospora azurea SZMC 14600]|uniref:alkaline phosphatase D family protein n=1 Tax=Saccharomonospora azurea TaxID=40988 RepID=UPI0002400396|nr:alkaline phosphatase D family protein [Saccharomonospora azurea]EHK87603.1 phosphodiesterase/alkaline phosphatase D [Saccharomonospora azurea SZMC 14600]